MTVTWTGSGGVFSILGRIIAAIRNTNGRRAVTDPDTTAYWGASGPIIKCLGTEITDITAQHAAAQVPWYDGIQATRDSMVAAQDQYISSLRDYAETFLINVVNADSPLSDKSIGPALTELIRQMDLNSKTVNRCTVSSAVAAAAANVSNCIVVCSTTGRFGDPLEYAFAEILVATVTDDHNTGATAGSESLSLIGASVESDKFNYLWPDGSGGSETLTVIDPEIDATSGGNLLTNSDFETWTVTNIPDSWTVLVGVVGTDIKKSASVTYDSSSGALEFVADGATLISIAQTLTQTLLTPAEVYMYNFWIRADSAPAAGVVKVDLIDSTNTVINDDAGTANSVTFNASTLTATYASFTGTFRLPTNLPSIVKLRISTPTAVTTGRSIYFDFGALAQATQAYTAGPYLTVFRASTDAIVNDRWEITISNNRGGVIQTFFEQAFDMSERGLALPSSGSPNISDGVAV